MTTAVQPPRLPLVGREREQKVMGEQIAELRAGQGRLVVISGTAGIGKTALLDALADEAGEDGALVLRGHCYDFDTTPPYGPWREIADSYRVAEHPSLLAEVLRADGSADAGSQSALFEQVRDYLTAIAGRQPLILQLEDLHWSDTASLELLRYLSRQLRALQLLIILTYRSDELERHHPLYQLLPSLIRDAGALRIDLRPLADDAMQTLVAERFDLPSSDESRLATYLSTHAEGNPLYVRELFETIEQDGSLRHIDGQWVLGDLSRTRVPKLVRQLIDTRLARLDDNTRELLAIAAVIGQRLPLDLWQRVSAATDEHLDSAVEQALETRLMEEELSEVGLRFSHALIRGALYEGIILTRRRIWHRRVAEALHGTLRPDPDVLAHHFLQARDPRAVEWLVRAGEGAQRTYALLIAAERFEAAAALLQGDPMRQQERGRLLYYVGWTLRHVGGTRAIPFLEEAEQIALATDDAVVAAYALHDRGAMRCFFGDARLGFAELEAGLFAIEALPTRHAPPGRSISDWLDNAVVSSTALQREPLDVTSIPTGVSARRGQYILWLGVAGFHQRALEEGQSFIRTLETSSDEALRATLASTRVGVGYAQIALGRPQEARRTFDHARAWFRAGGEWTTFSSLSLEELISICLAYQTHDLNERERLAAQAEDAFQRAGGGTADDLSPCARVPLLLLDGRWSEAQQIASDLVATAGVYRPYLLYVLGTLHRLQGRPRAAWTCLSDGLPNWLASEPGDYLFQESLDLFRLAGDLALDDGNLETARAWLEMHTRWLDWGDAVRRRAEDQLTWARFYRLAGNRQLAEQHAAAAVAHAREPHQPLALLVALRTLGELSTEAGRSQAAEAALQESLEIANACLAPFEQGLTLLALAEARAATGRRDEGQAFVESVYAICEPLGATPTLARADALAARLGRPRRAAPAGLSPREVEVLRMLAAGHSTKQIALDLGMRVRTAERHIHNMYAKLGVSSRAEAIAQAHRNNLT